MLQARILSNEKNVCGAGKKICRNVVQMNFNDITYFLVTDKSDKVVWK